MRNEWFKVEVLQDYYGEDAGPSLDYWLKGDKKRSINLIKAADYSKWVEDCRKKLEQGVRLTRMHIVEEPYSPYIEWELEHYKYVNIPKCGEEIYLVNRLEFKDSGLPSGDLMIFDKKRAVVNKYNSRGRMTHQSFYDETDKIGRFLELRKTLMERAQPL